MLRPLLGNWFAVILAGWLVSWHSYGVAVSQEQSDEKSAKQIGAATGNQDATTTQDPLKILWLRNPATGELVPVPGLTIDEYDKLDRIRRGLPAEAAVPPNFLLSELKVSGNAKGRLFSGEMVLELELRDDHWARIPLGLSRAVIRSIPSEKEWLVAPDGASDGLILWAKGKEGDKKTLRLEFDHPIEVANESTQLKMALPRARTASANLTIETSESSFRLESAGKIDSTKFSEGVGEVYCSGFTSTLDLTWKPTTKPAANSGWLEAAGPTEIRVDGRRQIRADARIRIRTFGSFEQPLRIKLPSGMRYSADAAQISPFVRSQSTRNSPADGSTQNSILELHLDPSAPSEFELRIQAESDSPISPDATTLKLEGFEVLGAKRQWGYFDLLLTSDWYVAAGQPTAVRRVDVEPGAAADMLFARSRFEFASSGSYIVVAARLPRTLVEPTYDVTIESGQLRLEAELKYRFRGPSAGAVEIDLADWNFENISSPDGAFLVDDIQQNGTKLLIPISPQPLNAGVDSVLRLEGRRDSEGAIARLRLPQPTANVETPAIVRVHSDVNMDITPRSGDFKGVAVDSASSLTSLPQQRTQFAYRTRPGAELPLLAFDVQVRKQFLLQSLNTQLSLAGPRTINVQHNIQLNVSYEPMRDITLDLPVPIAALESAQVLLDDQPLQRTDAVENEVVDENGYHWTRCKYSLPRAILGPLTVSIQLPVVVRQAEDEEAIYHLPLPKLLTSSQVQSKRQQLEIQDATQTIQLESSDWSSDLLDDTVRTGDSARRFSASTPQESIELKLAEVRAQAKVNNHCERWWLQTTIGENLRHDRLCVQLSTWLLPLQIRLPEGVNSRSLIIAVDGNRESLSQDSVDDRVVVLRPPRDGAKKSRVVEFWYQCEIPHLSWGKLNLDGPSFIGEESYHQIFWQLLTPADWYSLRRPPGWTLEYSAGVKDRWGNVSPALSQKDLEKWVGASSQGSPPVELNSYLFSSFKPRSSLSLFLAPRRELWFFGLGLIFAFGTLLIQFPVIRRPIVLLILPFAAAAAVIFDPNWSMAIVQFLIVGLASTVVVWILKVSFTSKRVVPVRPAPSRSHVRSIETAALPSDSASSPRRGSSISASPASVGPVS